MRRAAPAGTAARLALACAALLGAASAHGEAEALYVIEQLVVNVNSAPDASGERIATVKSGDRLEVLERAHDQVHVRLASGKDGWVRASYLTADEPLRARLAQRDAQLAQLQQDVGRLQAQLAAAQTAASAPGSAASGTAGAASGTAAAGEDPGGAAARPLFAGPEEPRQRRWPWILGAALGGLAVGGALGVLLLDRHIRRRYGGLRIY